MVGVGGVTMSSKCAGLIRSSETVCCPDPLLDLGEKAEVRGLWSVMIWEVPTFNKMLKMFDGEVDGKEFSVKSAVLGLWGA